MICVSMRECVPWNDVINRIAFTPTTLANVPVTLQD
jgi:hypothetical protein